jgi:hypothetical protein
MGLYANEAGLHEAQPAKCLMEVLARSDARMSVLIVPLRRFLATSGIVSG